MKKMICAAAAAVTLLAGCAKPAEPVHLNALQLYGMDAFDLEALKFMEVAQDETGAFVQLGQAVQDQKVISAFEVSSESDLPSMSVQVYSYSAGVWTEVGSYPLDVQPSQKEYFGVTNEDQQGFFFSKSQGTEKSNVMKIDPMTFTPDVPIAVSVKQEAELQAGKKMPVALIYQAQERPKLDLPEESLDDLSVSILNRLDKVYGLTLTMEKGK